MKTILKFILVSNLLLAICSCTVFHTYRPTFSQGNIITQDKVSQVHVGMSAEQVRVIMGTPLIVNTFSDTEWNYVYTLQRAKQVLQYDRVIVHFQNGVVSDIDADVPPPPKPRWHWFGSKNKDI